MPSGVGSSNGDGSPGAKGAGAERRRRCRRAKPPGGQSESRAAAQSSASVGAGRLHQRVYPTRGRPAPVLPYPRRRFRAGTVNRAAD